MPDYRIEPPDVIQIEMLKLVPKQRQPVTGQYLVAPDGTVNLRQYGRVCLMGKTVAEARLAIQKQLATYLESPELAVDVVAYNSKVYYIITQGAGLGDNVRRLPVTGKETVLDAISQVNGLSQVSSKKICVVRPSAADGGKAAILPVDWEAVTSRGATATNYQIFPGDRIFIAQNPLVTRSNLIAAKTAPIERIMGIVELDHFHRQRPEQHAGRRRGTEGTPAEGLDYRRRGTKEDRAGCDPPRRSGQESCREGIGSREAGALILPG